MIDCINRKKRWLLGLYIFFVLILCGTAVFWSVYHRAEQRYGLSLAPEVSHEVFATNEDRVRFVVRPEFLLPYIEDYSSEEAETDIMGHSTKDIFRQFIPREIALMARADLPSDKIYLTLFANERRGGPFIEEWINSMNVLSRIPGVNWNPGGLELRGRGSLVAEGNIVFPESYKESRLEYWPLYSMEQVLTVSGDHLLELVIDNSNGDILTFFAIMAAFLGEDWQNIIGYLFTVPILGHFGPPPSPVEFYEPAVSVILPVLESIHINANIKNKDTIMVLLSMRVEPEKGPYISDLISLFTYYALKEWLKTHLNLILDGSLQWDEKQNLIIGSYSVSGMQQKLKNIIGSAAMLVRDNEVMFDMAYIFNMLLQH